MIADARRAMVEAHAATFKVGVFYGTARQKRGWTTTGVLYVPWELEDDTNFLVALHELGHRALGHVRRKTDSKEIIHAQEIEAWEWAMARPEIQITPELARFALRCLSTYADKYGGSRRIAEFTRTLATAHALT